MENNTLNLTERINTPDAHKINSNYDGLIIDFEEALEVITDPDDIPHPLVRLVKTFN